MPIDETKKVLLRVPAALLAKVDAFVRARRTPYARRKGESRNDVLIALVTRGLAAMKDPRAVVK